MCPVGWWKVYRLELGEVLLGRELVGAAHGEDLPAGAVLPVRVHGEEDGRPGEEVGGRLLAGEEEGLALLQHVRHGYRRRLLAAGIDHEPQQVPEAAAPLVGEARAIVFVLLGLVAAAADEGDEPPPDLPVQAPRQPVLLGRQEPANRFESRSKEIERQPAGDLTVPVAGDADVPVAGDEDLAEGLGGEGHEARLHAEHGAAGVVAAPERGARDGLLGHRLEPLGHVHLHLAAGGGGHRPPPLRQRRHRPADVRRQPLRTEGRKGHGTCQCRARGANH